MNTNEGGYGCYDVDALTETSSSDSNTTNKKIQCDEERSGTTVDTILIPKPADNETIRRKFESQLKEMALFSFDPMCSGKGFTSPHRNFLPNVRGKNLHGGAYSESKLRVEPTFADSHLSDDEDDIHFRVVRPTPVPEMKYLSLGNAEKVLKDIEQRHKSADTMNQDLRAKLAARDSELNKKSAALQKTQEDNKTLKCKLNEVSKKLAMAQQDKSDDYKCILQLEREQQTLIKTLQDYESQLENSRTKAKCRENTIGDMQSDMDAAQQKIYHLTGCLKEISDKLKEREQQWATAVDERVQRLDKKLHDREQDNQRLKCMMVNAEKHNQQLQQKLDDSMAKENNLLAEKAQLEKRTRDMSETEKEKLHLYGLMESKEEKVQSLKEELTARKNDLLESRETNESLNEKIMEMREFLQQAIETSKEQNSEIDCLREKLEEARRDLKYSEDKQILQTEELAKTVADLRIILKETQKAINDKDQLITDLEGDKEAFSQDRDKLEEAMNKEAQKYNCQIANMKQTISDLEYQYSEMETSLNMQQEALQKAQLTDQERNAKLEEKEQQLVEKEKTLSCLKDTINNMANKEKITVEKLAHEISENEGLTAEIEKQNHKLEDRKQQLDQKTAELVQQQLCYQSNTEKLQKRLDQANCEGVNHKSLVEKLQKQINILQNELKETSQHCDQFAEMKALIARKESSKQILEAENKKLNMMLVEHINKYETDVKQLTTQLSNLRMDNKSRKSDDQVDCMSVSNPQLQTIKGKISQLHEEISQVRTAMTQTSQVLARQESNPSIFEKQLKCFKSAQIMTEDPTTDTTVYPETSVSLDTKFSHFQSMIHNVTRELSDALNTECPSHHANTIRSAIMSLNTILEGVETSNKSAVELITCASETIFNLATHQQSMLETLKSIEIETKLYDDRRYAEIKCLKKQLDDENCRFDNGITELLKSRTQEMERTSEENSRLEQQFQHLKTEYRNLRLHSKNTHSENESLLSTKDMLEQNIVNLEGKMCDIENHDQKRLARLTASNAEMSITHQHTLTELKSAHSKAIKNINACHEKRLSDVYEQLKESEKRNSKIQAELNRMGERVTGDNSIYKREIVELHGKIQRLKLEKQEMIDYFDQQLEQIRSQRENDYKSMESNRMNQETKIAELLDENDFLQNQNGKFKEQQQRQLESLSELQTKYETARDSMKNQEKDFKEKMCQKDTGIDTLQRELAENMARLTAVDIENLRLQNENKRLEEATSDLKRDKNKNENEWKKNLRQMQIYYQKMDEQATQLKLTLQSGVSERRALVQQNKILEDDIRHLNSVIDMYKETVSSNQHRFTIHQNSDHLKDTNIHTSRKNDPGTSSSNTRQDSVSKLEYRRSMDNLGCQIAALQNELSGQKELHTNVVKQLHELQQKYSYELEQHDATRKELLETKEQRTSCEQAICELRQKIESAEKTLKERSNKIRSLQVELADQTSAFRANNDKLQLEVTTLEPLRGAAQSVAFLENELKLVRQREPNLLREVASLKKEISLTKETYLRRERCLLKEVDTLKTEVAHLKGSLTHAHTANQSLEAYISHLNQTYNQMFQ